MKGSSKKMDFCGQSSRVGRVRTTTMPMGVARTSDISDHKINKTQVTTKRERETYHSVVSLEGLDGDILVLEAEDLEVVDDGLLGLLLSDPNHFLVFYES